MGNSIGWPTSGPHAFRCSKDSLMSDDDVPLTYPVVTPVLNEYDNMISHPRVLPFLRTSDLRKMISEFGGQFHSLHQIS